MNSSLRLSRLVPIAVVILLSFICLAPLVHAQGGGTPSPSGGGGTPSPSGGGGTPSPSGSTVTLENPLKSINSLPDLLHAILGAVVEIGSIILVLMLVYVGFLFVVARGNPESISKARSALMWTLIGGLILLGAEAISKVIEATAAQL